MISNSRRPRSNRLGRPADLPAGFRRGPILWTAILWTCVLWSLGATAPIAQEVKPRAGQGASPAPRISSDQPAPGSAASSQGQAPKALPFGFRALEIFKVHGNTLGLQAVDINRDGLEDLVLANNAEGTILLMLQKKPGEEADDVPGIPKKRNEVESHGRFRVEKFYTDKRISSLKVLDFNSDGRPDLVYYSDPPELEVVYQEGIWGSRRVTFPIRDGNQGAYALNASDLDRDGRVDLLLLGDRKTYVLYQKKDGGLGQPLVLYNAIPGVVATEIADVNGDGRPDLLNIVPSEKESVLVRLKTPAGFGPELGCSLRAVAAWHVADFPAGVDAPPATTLLTVQKSDSRLKLYRWREKPAESGLGAPYLVALRNEGDPDDRHRQIADVDGDGRLDVVISYPETARLEVYFQDEGGSLSRSKTYPTLSGVNGLVSADLDGDGSEEIVVISRKEKALGITRWKEGRLRFPQTLTNVDPLLVAAAPLEVSPGKPGGALASQIFLVVEEEGSKFSLRVLRHQAGENTDVAKLPLDLGGTAPSSMRVFDGDGDGRTDVLLFVPYSDPYLFLQVEPDATDSGKATAVDDEPGGGKSRSGITFHDISRDPGFGIGQLSKLSPVALCVSRLDEGESGAAPDLLVASKSYVRALRLNAKGKLQVVDQFSGHGAGSDLAASAVLQLNETPAPEIVLYNRASLSLEVLAKKEDGTYEFASGVKLPKFDLVRLDTRDMNSDGRDDLVIHGKEKIGILYGGEAQEGFQETLSFALEERKDLGSPRDLTVGDLNSDGTPDVVLNTSPRYNLMFLTHYNASTEGEENRQESLERRLTFPIFEEKTYMRRSSTNLGPRHMLVSDIDGDGLQDLVMLIHDRILLYLQDTP